MAVAAKRSEESTPESVNERIRRETRESIAHVVALGPAALDARLRELDREWDTERVLETVASSFVLSGVTLAAFAGRKWLALPAIVAALLLEHAIQGWCPPLPIVRALGVRTRREIDRERAALKAARGDFLALPKARSLHPAAPSLLLQAAER